MSIHIYRRSHTVFSFPSTRVTTLSRTIVGVRRWSRFSRFPTLPIDSTNLASEENRLLSALGFSILDSSPSEILIYQSSDKVAPKPDLYHHLWRAERQITPGEWEPTLHSSFHPNGRGVRGPFLPRVWQFLCSSHTRLRHFSAKLTAPHRHRPLSASMIVPRAHTEGRVVTLFLSRYRSRGQWSHKLPKDETALAARSKEADDRVCCRVSFTKIAN